MGLLSRAVVKNRYASLTQIAPWFGVTEPDTQLHHGHMRALATGRVDIAKLAAFTEHRVEDIENAALRIGRPNPGGVFDEYIATHSWRFCPSCFWEGRPHRRSWLVPFVTACTEHGCELIDQCQFCHHPYGALLPLTPYCACCQKSPVPTPATSQELECAKAIESQIDDSSGLKRLLDRLMTAWLLSTPETLRPHHRFSPQLKPVSVIRPIVDRIWHAAKDTESLANALNAQMAEMTQRWRRLPSASTLMNRRLVELNADLPSPGTGTGQRDGLSSKESWMVPLQAAAVASGLSEFIIRGLADAGCIRSELFSEVGNDRRRHRFRMIDLDSLNEVIEELFQVATTVQGQTGLAPILMTPLHEVITGSRAGKISIFKGNGDAVADLKVRFNQTSTYARRAEKPADALTAQETAELLGTYHAVVANLSELGFIKRHPAGTSRRLLIDKGSVHAFNKKYVAVGTLAERYNINPTNLAEKLLSFGIQREPWSTLVAIYQRSALSSVNMDEVINRQTYETRTGRKSTVDISSVRDPRIVRLIQLVDAHGGATNFTRKYGGSIGNLSLILRERKTFGDLAARRMAARVGLPVNYFDQ